MNKAELIAAVAAKTGDTKKGAEATVNAFVDVVTEALQKGQLEKEETHKLRKKSKYLHQKHQYSKLEKH